MRAITSKHLRRAAKLLTLQTADVSVVTGYQYGEHGELRLRPLCQRYLYRSLKKAYHIRKRSST